MRSLTYTDNFTMEEPSTGCYLISTSSYLFTSLLKLIAEIKLGLSFMFQDAFYLSDFFLIFSLLE